MRLDPDDPDVQRALREAVEDTRDHFAALFELRELGLAPAIERVGEMDERAVRLLCLTLFELEYARVAALKASYLN